MRIERGILDVAGDQTDFLAVETDAALEHRKFVKDAYHTLVDLAALVDSVDVDSAFARGFEQRCAAKTVEPADPLLNRLGRPGHAEEDELARMLQVQSDLRNVGGDQQLLFSIHEAAKGTFILVDEVDE